jgi:hypothetical protein
MNTYSERKDKPELMRQNTFYWISFKQCLAIFMVLENEIVDRKVDFRLSEDCLIDNVGSSQKVKFWVKNNGGNKLLTGFSIITKEFAESVAIFDANQKAVILSNFLTVKYGKYIRSFFIGFSKLNKDGTQTVTGLQNYSWLHIRKLNVDFKDSITAVILQDKDKGILYDHASRGIKAVEDQDPVTMIREFYQIIETNTPTHLKKFQSLRHVLSHGNPIDSDTIRNLESEFGQNYFTFTSKKHFDYTSPRNIERLNEQARYLKNEVKHSKLSNELQIKKE